MLSSGRGHSRTACINARNQCVLPAPTLRLSSAMIWRASVSSEAVASARGLISLLNESAGAVALLVFLAAAAGTGVIAADLAANRRGRRCRVPGPVAGLRGGLAAGAAPVAGASRYGGALGVTRRPAVGRLDSDRRGRPLVHRRQGRVGAGGGRMLLNMLRPLHVHVVCLARVLDERVLAPVP